MATFTGFNGSVKIAANAVAEIDNWDLTIDTNMYVTTKFGDTWKGQIPGIKSWSGKFSGRWDQTDTNGQAAAQSALLGGTTVTLNLYTDATHKYSGTAYIKATNPKAAVDATVDTDYTFEGTGALSYS